MAEPLTKSDFQQLLAEGFHTAFRKASEHPTAHQIWMLIRHDFPNREWGNVISFVADGIWPSIEAERSTTRGPRRKPARAGKNPRKA